MRPGLGAVEVREPTEGGRVNDFAAGMLTGWLIIIVWAVVGVLTRNVKFEWWRGK